MHYVEPATWATIYKLLSLDRVQPFLDDMGLFLEHASAFQSSLRQLTSEIREARVHDPDELPDLGAALLGSTRLHSHPYDARLVVRWAARTFATKHADQPHLSGWRIALRFLNQSAGACVLISHIDAKALAREVERADNTELIESRMDDARLKPLSYCDQDIYILHGWDDGAEQDDPLSMILFTITAYRTQRLLGWLADVLDPAHACELTVAAQAILDRFGVWTPEPLLEPAALTEAF